MPVETAPAPPPANVLGIALRIGVYAFLGVLGLTVFGAIIHLILAPNDQLVTPAFGTFAGAALANAVVLRIWERAQLSDLGLGWNPASRRNLLLGVAGGAVAAAIVVLLPVVFGAASFERTGPFDWRSVIFVSVVLMFGAVGEEMLFRGYAFQILLGPLGRFATILPFGVLFGVAHLGNFNQTLLGVFNTIAWGVLLCYAFVRSGDLWLPIGLHFGWNWILPLLGVNLSGFNTMGLTGLALRWNVGPLWSGGNYGPEGGAFTTLVIIAVVLYLRYAPIEPQKPFLVRPVEA